MLSDISNEDEFALEEVNASIYHPLLRRQITLVTMEAEAENQRNVSLFWNPFNECLRKLTRNSSCVFNPMGFCTDMAGANLAGLKEVFG